MMSLTYAGTVQLLYMLNGGVIGGAFLWSFARKRLYSLLWAALLVFHLISYLDLNSLLNDFALATLLQGQTLMLFGNVVLVTTLLFFDKGPLSILPEVINRQPPQLFGVATIVARRYLYVMMGVAVAAILIQLANGTAMVQSNWVEARAVDDRYYLRPLSTVLGFVFFPSTWVAARQRQWISFCILAACGCVMFFVSGSRAMVITFGGAAFIDILTSNWRLRAKFGILLAGGIAGYFMHVALRVVRGLGLGGFMTAVAAGTLGDRFAGHEGKLGLGGEEGAYRTYYYVLDRDYDYFPYRSWVTPTRLLMIYVPSSVVGGIKPPDITSQLWYDGFDDGFLNDSPDFNALTRMARDSQGGSIHPHFWGDAYANGHVLGVMLYAIAFGAAVVFADRLFIRAAELSYYTIAPCFCVGLIFIARGSVVAGVGCFAYGLPFVVLISLLARLPLLGKLPRATGAIPMPWSVREDSR